MAPVVNYELKNQRESSKNAKKEDSSQAVGFAHELLAKHEAKMRQREKEGLYPPTPEQPTPDSAKQSNNYQMVGDGQITIFQGEASDDAFTPRDQLININNLIVDATPESMQSHFRSLQRVEELNESLENLNSARSGAGRGNTGPT